MTHYQQQLVSRSVFRAYDIRGVIGEQLDENAYYSIGRAISCKMRAIDSSAIFLARDGRLTSPKLSAALQQGLIDSGIDVYDLGAVPTPVMYFATHQTMTDCGLIVTGSHNPANYNGIKMVLAGKTLVSQDIEELFELNQSQKKIDGTGTYHKFEILKAYSQRILSDIKLERQLKVVVDCGNGIAGEIAPQILQDMGCEVIPLYCDVDGRFPNHHPDPTVEENLADLKALIKREKADLGLAFDGDADRLGVVTELGELIWPDRLMMMYSKDVLKRNPSASIVYDVKCSSHLAQFIEGHGGIAKMCPTGHSIVKAVMKAEKAALAGEMSGHLFFKDRWYGFDDAIYSAGRLLEILSQSTQNVSTQFAEIPNSINTPEIKIPISDEEKFSFMKRLAKSGSFPNAKVIDIDGLRIEYPFGWGLIRASNTTPCLVARFEAEDKEKLTFIQLEFKAQLNKLDESLKLPF